MLAQSASTKNGQKGIDLHPGESFEAYDRVLLIPPSSPPSPPDVPTGLPGVMYVGLSFALVATLLDRFK